MNQQQKTKLQEIIESDCKTQYVYCNSGGETCALGAMLLACGFTKEELIALPFLCGAQISISNIEFPTRGVNKLQEEFGLSIQQLREIQYRNDAYIDPERRRLRILDYLDECSLESQS